MMRVRKRMLSDVICQNSKIWVDCTGLSGFAALRFVLQTSSYSLMQRSYGWLVTQHSVCQWKKIGEEKSRCVLVGVWPECDYGDNFPNGEQSGRRRAGAATHPKRWEINLLSRGRWRKYGASLFGGKCKTKIKQFFTDTIQMKISAIIKMKNQKFNCDHCDYLIMFPWQNFHHWTAYMMECILELPTM